MDTRNPVVDAAYWRYADIQRAGIVNNRTTLRRWIKDNDFPPGFLIGRHTRAWRVADVVKWVEDKENNINSYMSWLGENIKDLHEMHKKGDPTAMEVANILEEEAGQAAEEHDERYSPNGITPPRLKVINSLDPDVHDGLRSPS